MLGLNARGADHILLSAHHTWEEVSGLNRALELR